MGNAVQIIGSKSSGKKTSTPTETPDSLVSIAYAKVLDLVSEGPIAGLVNGLQSIYLDKTPLANPDGSLNFTGVTVETRNGEADQDYVPGFPSVESETAVGVELTFGKPWVQAITNPELSAVRVRLQVPYLTSTDSKGNVNGYEVRYAIDVATDSGAFQEVLSTSFNGKTTSTYERSHRVELPTASTGWRIRIRRLTEDAPNNTIQSATNIASYTEIIDAKLRYPYTAVVGITVDASQFSSIPSRAYDCKLRIIRVPSNYDPESRNYSGSWDGTFKLAWTDNPAWIYYDLILNDRYGLGELISAAQVDKWGLYQIARYCDELVDDGKGGTEPRFVCNVYLQSRADALQVIQDLASIFRGMSYWAAGSVTAVADMPSDPVYTYNQANVIDGKFTYAGSSRSTRYSVALVSWNDPSSFYDKKVEYVSDQKSLARYGVQQTEITAFGCTSQGQAQRLGHYTLLTNRLENETISFAVGMDGAISRPGQIIRVADPARAGRRIGGRIKDSTATTVTLDADTVVSAGDTITIILPTGIAETRSVKSYSNRVVTVTNGWTSPPVAQSVFAVESSTLVAQTYRVLSVAENMGQGDLRYNITAIKHVSGKYAAIDNGAQIVTLPVTIIPNSVQAAPTNIQLSTYDSVDQGMSVTTLRATWDVPANAVSYDVWWRRNSNDWIYAGRTYTASMEIRGIYAGTYMVRVAAYNALDTASLWAYSAATALTGKTAEPPLLAFLRTVPEVYAIRLNWGFPSSGAEDTAYTEIQYGPAVSEEGAQSLGLFSYPTNTYTMQGLAAGVSFFFRGRLIDRIGNIGPWTNWVNGQSSSDATEILTYLVGKITKTELAQELLAPIENLEGVSDKLDEIEAEIGHYSGSIQRIDGVIARFDPPMAGDDTIYAGDEDIIAGVYSEQSARADADEANARAIDAVAAKIVGSEYNSRALVNTERITRVTADTALAQRIDTVQANVNDTAALVQAETTARVQADQAISGQVTNLQSTVAGNTSAIQVNAQAIATANGKLSSSYSIKTEVTANGQRYAAGIALGVDYSGGDVTSQFLVMANRFAVLNQDGSGVTAPFVIQNGQTFINQAFIGDGTITNAKIGETIQSTALGTNGQPMWSLSKSGAFVLNSNDAGGRSTMTANAYKVFDANGVLRVQLGNLLA